MTPRNKLCFLWCVLFCTSCATRSLRLQTRPRRLLVMVLDQFRPDYVSRLQLANIQALARRSAVFDNAWVGHLPATTVISHEVLPRGRFPANLPWGDDLFHDVEGKIGEKGRMYDPGELSFETMKKLLTPYDNTHMARAVPGKGRFLVVGQKRYAVFAMAGSLADVVVTFSETLKDDAGTWAGWAHPDGHGMAAWLQHPPGNRFWVDTRPTLGTDACVYKLGGYKYAPLVLNERVGGDAWVTEIAMRLMEEEDWRVALLTFGAIDRVGHMFGADLDLLSPNPHLPLANVVRFADAQVGRMFDFLHRKGYDRDTLVVVTADHGGLGTRNWQGVDRPGGALDNWMWGDVANVITNPQLRPVLEPLLQWGLRAAYTDTLLRLYFHSNANPKRVEVVAQLPGVVWVGEKRAVSRGFTYATVYDAVNTIPQQRDRKWLVVHLPTLLQTYASHASPDLLAVLDAQTSYGQRGEHGGAQEMVQRIPLYIAGPGVTPGVRYEPVRLVDLAPTVWEMFAGYVVAGMNGKSFASALTVH